MRSPEQTVYGRALAIGTAVAALAIGQAINREPAPEPHPEALDKVALTAPKLVRKAPIKVTYLPDPKLPIVSHTIYLNAPAEDETSVNYLGPEPNQTPTAVNQSRANKPVTNHDTINTDKKGVGTTPAILPTVVSSEAPAGSDESSSENTEPLPEEPAPENEIPPGAEITTPAPKTVRSAQEAIDRFSEPNQLIIRGLVAVPGGKSGAIWYDSPVIMTFAESDAPLILSTATDPNGKQVVQADIAATTLDDLQIYSYGPDSTANLALTSGDIQCVASLTGNDRGECRDVNNQVFGKQLTQVPSASGTQYSLIHKGEWLLAPNVSGGPKG